MKKKQEKKNLSDKGEEWWRRETTNQTESASLENKYVVLAEDPEWSSTVNALILVVSAWSQGRCLRDQTRASRIHSPLSSCSFDHQKQWFVAEACWNSSQLFWSLEHASVEITIFWDNEVLNPCRMDKCQQWHKSIIKYRMWNAPEGASSDPVECSCSSVTEVGRCRCLWFPEH